MDQKIYDMLESNPVIAAVKDTDGLEECVGLEDIKVVFILFGDICSIPGIVQRSGMRADRGCHVDLINGLGSREIAVDFIRENTQADGIISTKPALIRRGNELGLFTVHRYFLIDSMALENIKSPQPGIRPGCDRGASRMMPDIIRKICQNFRIPVIAGGLISDKKSVMAALSAGAVCVSSTNRDVWRL